MKQKLLGLAGLFLMVLAFCYSNAVRAEIPRSDLSVEKTVDEEVLDDYLLKQGFPQETVADLDYGTKLTYYEEQAEFVGEVITYFDENGWVISRRQMGTPWKKLSAKDQADKQMTLTLSLAEAGTEERYLMIRLAYDWQIHPVEKCEDLMCLSYQADTMYQRNDGSSWYVNLRNARTGDRLRGYSISKMDPVERAGTLALRGYYVHCTEATELSYELRSGGVYFDGVDFTEMNIWGQFEYDLTD